MEPPYSTVRPGLQELFEDGTGRPQLLNAGRMGDFIELGTEETVLCCVTSGVHHGEIFFIVGRGSWRSSRVVCCRRHAAMFIRTDDGDEMIVFARARNEDRVSRERETCDLDAVSYPYPRVCKSDGIGGRRMQGIGL